MNLLPSTAMKTRPFLLSSVVLALALQAGSSAMATLITFSSTVGQMIPDNNPNGLANTIWVSTPSTSISDVIVTLGITGGWNGDYYAYLRHGSSAFAVLLNRVGTPGNGGYGYGDTGFGADGGGQALTLSDAGTFDVHTYQAHSPLYNGSGQLTGTWQPDGSSFASSFGGMDPNGAWTLFIADLSTVGVGTLQNWSVRFTPVPESSTFITSAFLLLPLVLQGVRHLRNRKRL